MIGAGPVPFALMPYVISNAKPDKELGGWIELNPVLLSTIFGASVEEIEKGIEFLCAPDPKSRTPDEEGRRLVKLGPFDYRVVNFVKYRGIRDEEDRREQNRLAQERWRAKQAAKKAAAEAKKKAKLITGGKPLPGESAYLKKVEEEGQEAADKELDRAQTAEEPPKPSTPENNGDGGMKIDPV